MARALRGSAALVLGIATLAAALGWLYVLRPLANPGGPAVHDALALDELPHTGSVSIVLYLAVWGVAAVTLGLLARWARAERITAGLLLASGVAGWLYAVNGVSILVVRQIPARAAFHAAAAEPAVAMPAALAGLAGALLGRSHAPGSSRVRFALAWIVGGVGVLAIVNALLPEHHRSLFVTFDAAHVHGLSKALVAPLGVMLVVAARSLARGNRRAFQIAAGVLTLLFVLHLERRFDDGAIVTGLTVVALVAARSSFASRGDPASRPRALMHLAVGAGVVTLYGLVTLWVNRLMADQPYTVGFALRVTARAVAGLSFRGADHLSGPVADWFPLSAFLLAAGTVVWVLVEWLRPWRYQLRQDAQERALARELVGRWGVDTLAPFALRADKSYFFSADRSVFLAYRVVGGVAIVAGDPIGASDGRERLLREFLAFAHERGWRVAVLGVSEEALGVYERLGLRALYHGDEAVVETASFSLDGRAIRKVRQSVHRLRSAGYRAAALRPSEIDGELRAQLEAIAAAWRGSEPERGFVMALDVLFGLDDDDAVFVVGFAPDGVPHGFLHYAVSRPGSALSLSSMPRLRDTPNGFNEWLICETIEWARANDYARVSLNFAPFAALLAPDGELSLGQRAEAAVLRRLKGWFQLDNLLAFNRKFFPEWEPRFVVYERRRDLPRVGVAALAAEAYLPFQ